MPVVSGGFAGYSMESNVLHFGLGDETAIDHIEVYWPGGLVQIEKSAGVNRLKKIRFKKGRAKKG